MSAKPSSFGCVSQKRLRKETFELKLLVSYEKTLYAKKTSVKDVESTRFIYS